MPEPKKPTFPPAESAPAATAADGSEPAGDTAPVEEVGGPGGPEPTRYGDWERKGRCIDF
jgi:hypothetical protein